MRSSASRRAMQSSTGAPPSRMPSCTGTSRACKLCCRTERTRGRKQGFNAALGLDPLHISAALGKLPELSDLLAHGANPNCRTSLRCFKPSIASFVPGADFKHTTGGDTALHIAIDCGNAEVVNTLLQQPAIDVNSRNDRGRTPLYKACKRNNQDLATRLSQHPAIDVNAGAPIFAAIHSRSHDLVALLLKAGASLDVTNDLGQVPMHYLATFFAIGFLGRATMILQLREAGADVNCIVQPGCTALDHAISNRWERVEHTLRSCGALRYPELLQGKQLGAGSRPSKQPAPEQAPVSSSGLKPPKSSPAQPVPKSASLAQPAPKSTSPAQPAPKSITPAQPAPKSSPPPKDSKSTIQSTAQSQKSIFSFLSRAPEPARPSAPSSSKGPQSGLCCVCLAAPAVLGFVHATVVHNCLCEGCKAELECSHRGLRTCLLCNSAASGVIRVVCT